MKYNGNFAEQDILRSKEYLKLYGYTLKQKREVILYYILEQECCLLKQVAICSEITEHYTMFWVFEYEYVEEAVKLDDFKKHCLQIVEEEILPYIKSEILHLND